MSQDVFLTRIEETVGCPVVTLFDSGASCSFILVKFATLCDLGRPTSILKRFLCEP